MSAHESKTRVVARAAMPRGPVRRVLRYDREIPEYVAGVGVLLLAEE